jgi:hypothetical protein
MMEIKDVSFVVDERIWGHRLYDEQLPHLAVLEFLNVFQSNKLSPLRETPGKSISYQPQHQIRLRNLLFNNPFVDMVRGQAIPDEAKWSAWIDLFKQDATEDVQSFTPHLRRNFSNFDDFARAIE